MFLVGRTNLIITKPDGSMLKKEVILYADPKSKSVGVKFVGESPLKGYSFDLMDTEIERIRQGGVQMGVLPDRV